MPPEPDLSAELDAAEGISRRSTFPVPRISSVT